MVQGLYNAVQYEQPNQLRPSEAAFLRRMWNRPCRWSTNRQHNTHDNSTCSTRGSLTVYTLRMRQTNAPVVVGVPRYASLVKPFHEYESRRGFPSFPHGRQAHRVRFNHLLQDEKSSPRDQIQGNNVFNYHVYCTYAIPLGFFGSVLSIAVDGAQCYQTNVPQEKLGWGAVNDNRKQTMVELDVRPPRTTPLKGITLIL